MRRSLIALGATIAIAGGGLLFSSPAEAAAKCPLGSNGNNFCLYYNSGETGAYYNWDMGVTSQVSNLAGYTFPANGTGGGENVKNDAASASFADPSLSGTEMYVRVYFNSGYLGSYDQINSNADDELVNTYNEDASWQTFCPTC